MLLPPSSRTTAPTPSCASILPPDPIGEVTTVATTNAIRFHKPGGPEVLAWEPVEIGNPGPGQALIRHTAVGLNYIDTYHRSGLYQVPLPSGIGMEGAGIVEAVASDVRDLAPGDRVA